MVLDTSVRFYEYWYFHVPNYVLAALMYSLLARFLLSFVFAPDSRNYIYRAFVWLTGPVLAGVRWITPRAVPPLLVVLLAAIWLILVRFALLVGFMTAGLAPKIAG